MRFSRQIGLAAVAAFLAFATQSFAAQIEFLGHGLSRRVDVFHQPTGNKIGEWAGVMNVEINNQLFKAFCVDLNNDADNDPWDADLIPVALSAVNGKMAIAFLYDTFSPNLATANQAAALQVAIWEVLDDSPGPRDLDLHIFRYLGASFESVANAAAIKTQAQTYLSQIPANVETTYVSPSLIVLDVTNPFAQTLIVPEPSSLSVLAIGAMLALRRRR